MARSSGPAREVERAVGLLLGQALRLRAAGRGGQGREVDQRQAPADGGRDHLDRPAVDLAERRAQHLVPAHDLAEQRREDGRRGLAADQQRLRDVVGREPRLQAVDEPQALLGEGERQRREVRRPARDAGRRRGGALLLLALADLFEQDRPLLAREPGEAVLRGCGIGHRASFHVRAAGQRALLHFTPRRVEQPGVGAQDLSLDDAVGQLAEVGGVEDHPQRHLDPLLLGQPRDELGGEQRMPAQREEVVAHPHPLEPQQGGHLAGEQLFERRRRSHPLARRRQGPLGRREGPPVHLAAGGERQRGEQDEGGRHHVVRQLGLQEAPQLRHQPPLLAGPQRIVGVGAPVSVRHPGGSGSHAGEDAAPAPPQHRVEAAVRSAAGGPGRGRRRSRGARPAPRDPRDSTAPASPASRELGIPRTARTSGRPSRSRSTSASDSHVLSARRLCARQLLAADVQDHVVAEAGQLVLPPPPLEQHLDPADPRQAPRQRREEGGIDHQLLLLRDAALHPLRQLGGGERSRGAMELDRGMERREQRQAADVAHEHGAAGRHGGDRPLQHLHQVVDAREVLDDRVEDDEIELTRRDAGPVVGEPLRQLDLRQRQAVEAGADLRQRHPREVGAPVALRVRRHPEEQQPRAAPHLEHPPVLQGEEARDRAVHPLRHLLGRDRLAGVAAVPTLDVEGRGPRLPPPRAPCRTSRRRGSATARRDRRLPWRPAPPRAAAPRRPPAAGRRPRRRGAATTASPTSGWRASDPFDLAELDAEAAQLDLMVEPPQEVEAAVRHPAHPVAGAVQPPSGRREGIGDEALGGEVRAAEIAAREPRAADRELPRHPGGGEIERAVEHVDRGAVDRAADRRRQAVSRHGHGSPRRHHAALRRAVVVHQGERERPPRHPHQPVAASQQGAQGRAPAAAGPRPDRGAARRAASAGSRG